MKTFIILIAITILFFIVMAKCESKKDPYEEGMHFDYTIICEGGFKYKCLDQRRGTIQLLNSDGTPLKCNQKRC